MLLSQEADIYIYIYLGKHSNKIHRQTLKGPWRYYHKALKVIHHLCLVSRMNVIGTTIRESGKFTPRIIGMETLITHVLFPQVHITLELSIWEPELFTTRLTTLFKWCRHGSSFISWKLLRTVESSSSCFVGTMPMTCQAFQIASWHEFSFV